MSDSVLRIVLEDDSAAPSKSVPGSSSAPPPGPPIPGGSPAPFTIPIPLPVTIKNTPVPVTVQNLYSAHWQRTQMANATHLYATNTILAKIHTLGEDRNELLRELVRITRTGPGRTPGAPAPGRTPPPTTFAEWMQQQIANSMRRGGMPSLLGLGIRAAGWAATSGAGVAAAGAATAVFAVDQVVNRVGDKFLRYANVWGASRAGGAMNETVQFMGGKAGLKTAIAMNELQELMESIPGIRGVAKMARAAINAETAEMEQRARNIRQAGITGAARVAGDVASVTSARMAAIQKRISELEQIPLVGPKRAAEVRQQEQAPLEAFMARFQAYQGRIQTIGALSPQIAGAQAFAGTRDIMANLREGQVMGDQYGELIQWRQRAEESTRRLNMEENKKQAEKDVNVFKTRAAMTEMAIEMKGTRQATEITNALQQQANGNQEEFRRISAKYQAELNEMIKKITKNDIKEAEELVQRQLRDLMGQMDWDEIAVPRQQIDIDARLNLPLFNVPFGGP